MKTNTNTTIAALALILTAPLHAQSKTLTWGNKWIGATVTGSMSHYIPVTKDSCSFYNTGRVDGTILTVTKTLVSGAANFRIANGSKASNASGYLKVGSKTLASWNSNFTGAGDYKTDTILGNVEGGSYDLIPYVLSVRASASLRINAKYSAYVTPAGGLAATAGVDVDAAVKAGATANALVASGGLEGSMSICKLGLVGKASMVPSTEPHKPNTNVVTYRTDFVTRSPQGSLDAWVKPFWKSKYSWNITRMNGSTALFNLASGSFELTKSTVRR